MKKDYHLFYKRMQDEKFNCIRFKDLTGAKRYLAYLISSGEFFEACVVLFNKKILEYCG